MEKAKRSANFTDREKEVLISLVKNHLNVLENKKTNAVFNKQKSQCWEKLAWEYNANQTSGMRTGQQLKTTYEQMKKIAKQHKSQDKVELLKTGGGSFISKMTNQDCRILTLIENNFFSMENEFDSNNTEESNYSMVDLEQPSTSTYDESENIIVVIDSANNENDITEEESPRMHNDNLHSNMSNETEERHKKKKQSHPVIENKENRPPSKKQKRKLPSAVILNNKRYDILQTKLRVLGTIEETEKESLKGKKLDNEIKQIVKEREMIELKMKQMEYEKLYNSC